MNTSSLINKKNTDLIYWKKQFTIYTFSSFSLVFFVSYLLVLLLKEHSWLMQTSKYFFFFTFLITAYIWYLLTKTKVEFDRFVTPISIFIIAVVFYLCLIHCHISSLCYTYYIPIVIISYTLNRIKKTLVLTLFLITISYFTKPLSVFLGLYEPLIVIEEMKKSIDIYNSITIIISSFFIISAIYFLLKFKKIEKNTENSREKTDLKTNLKVLNLEREQDKFETIYTDILLLFENEKPYQNPEFNIKLLSRMLKTNHVYVSKTLNEKSNKSFKHFINHYRINQILEDFDKRKYKKHTIESIYTNAGFTQQSTFNRVFKEFKGITPSEYIEQIENNFTHVA